MGVKDEDRQKEYTRRYLKTAKGKAAKRRNNQKQYEKQKRLMVTFRGEDLSLYELLLKVKKSQSFNKIALTALKEWVLTNF